MKCPHCGEEIGVVAVHSESQQLGYLKGNKIVEYGDVETGVLTKITCPECEKDITKFIIH